MQRDYFFPISSFPFTINVMWFRSSILVLLYSDNLNTFFVQITFCCLPLILMKNCKLAVSVRKPVISWKVHALLMEIYFKTRISLLDHVFTQRDRDLVKNYKPQTGLKLRRQPHELIMIFFYPQIQIFSISLSPFSSKCHFPAGHENSAVMCASLQFLSMESGQCYKDDHVDLTKQSHPPAPDTDRQLVKAQQGQIFQTLDTSFRNHFSQDISFKLQAHVLPRRVFGRRVDLYWKVSSFHESSFSLNLYCGPWRRFQSPFCFTCATINMQIRGLILPHCVHWLCLHVFVHSMCPTTFSLPEVCLHLDLFRGSWYPFVSPPPSLAQLRLLYTWTETLWSRDLLALWRCQLLCRA